MAKTSKPVIKIAFDAIEVLLFLNDRLASTVSASRVGHCGSSGIELKSALQYGHFKASSPMLLAQWGQSLVRIPPLVTNDLPSFGQKTTLSSYSVEHCGHCFMGIILNIMNLSVKRNHRHWLVFGGRIPGQFVTCPSSVLRL